jgi:hypothetical protein
MTKRRMRPLVRLAVAVGILTAAVATGQPNSVEHAGAAAKESQCRGGQPTYTGQLTVDGHQRLAYVFCAWGEHMYVADTYADGEGVAVATNGGRKCTDNDGSNNGATHCNWELREGSYMDLCLIWAGTCRAAEWATASGYCLPGPKTNDLSLRTKLVSGKGRLQHSSRPRVRGWLRTPDGTPVAGARVCVSSQLDLPEAAYRDNGFVVTNESGRFTYRGSKGASRRLHFVHRAGSGVAADSVRVRVRAPVGVRASESRLQNGETVTLRGKLRSGPFPKHRGALVEVQVDRGTHWQNFGTTRANDKGSYSFAYQFTNTTGTQRYRLRARVPAQSGYPYATGSSRPVMVTVSG